MLTVKTTLGRSNIAGIGLFANEFIPKGTIIWKFDERVDRVFTEEEFHSMPPKTKAFLKTYCFMFSGKYYLCIDNARFFNHSDTPNCASAEFNETDLGYTIAKTDIQIGEELTDDYSHFGLTEKDREFNIDLFTPNEL